MAAFNGGLLAPASLVFVVFGLFYALYQWLLPKPFPNIPYNHKSARRLLGDAPDMVREVGVTRELNVWLVRQVKKMQAPLCQVFIDPFSKPWLLLADSVEAQDIMMRRPDFDRSNFITDGLSPMDNFHARMKTGDEHKATRAWLQDLMTPRFLNNVASPVMFDNTLRLVDFWKLKAQLAQDRAFDVNEDLDHSALDGMLAFVFDRDFEHTALGPQMKAVSALGPTQVETGPHGQAVFPHAPVHEFISALYETVDAIDKVTKAMSPTLAMWWIRKTASFRKVMAVKRRVVKDQVRIALGRLESTGEARTAIEHMLMREKKTAEKQGRQPDFENKTMEDEVCSAPKFG